MKAAKFTWIGFLVTLSTLSITSKTIADETNSSLNSKSEVIESRLSRIAKTLKQQENELLESSDTQLIDEYQKPKEVAIGWVKGYRGGFVNGYGGGFANRRGWRDGGGFLNRRWPNGGGFFNRRF